MMDFVKNWLHFAKKAGLTPYLVGAADGELRTRRHASLGAGPGTPAPTALQYRVAGLGQTPKAWQLHSARGKPLRPCLRTSPHLAAALQKFCDAEGVSAAAINPRLDVWTYALKPQAEGEVFEMKTQWQYFRRRALVETLRAGPSCDTALWPRLAPKVRVVLLGGPWPATDRHHNSDFLGMGLVKVAFLWELLAPGMDVLISDLDACRAAARTPW